MKVIVILICLGLSIFADNIKANNEYLLKIMAILGSFNLDEREKTQLAQKINDDLCGKMQKQRKQRKGVSWEIPDFLQGEGGKEGTGFYKVNYYKKEDGEVEIKAWVSRYKNPAKKSIELEKLDRPLCFDFSKLSNEEIQSSLESELDKLDVDSGLKETICPLLHEDLCQKLRKPEKNSFFRPPRFLGGRSAYRVDYYRFENDKVEIDTHTSSCKKGENSIELNALRKPLDFNYSGISKNKIHETVKEVLAKENLEKSLHRELTRQIVDNLYERLQEKDRDRCEVPDFLGGVGSYCFIYYMERYPSGQKPIMTLSCIGAEGVADRIHLREQEGESICNFFRFSSG